MALPVLGKTALVTGAGSGICLEFAKLLLHKSCNIVIADLALTADAERLVQEYSTKAEGKARVVFKKTDVTNWSQLRAAFDTAISEFGALDIVCPGAGVFEPPWSSFWHPTDGVDKDETNAYKSLEININHPIRATQLAIDTFKRLGHGHGVVLMISSIAAQGAFLPVPLYAASKAAISSFTRSLAPLEQMLNIRVVAVAPGIVKTPIWDDYKRGWVNEELDQWVTTTQVAEVMLDLVQKSEYVGGAVVEVGVESNRLVERLNDPGPAGKGFGVSNIMGGFTDVVGLVEKNFGK